MKDQTPQPTDDRELADRKSESVEERVSEKDATPTPVIDAPGAPTMPYAGVGVLTDPGGADLGPGEAVLKQEGSAQRGTTQRG